VGFHAARGIHGVAPDIVDKLVRPDDAGNDRAGMNADARLKAQVGRVGD
jgi:hypothetical protein